MSRIERVLISVTDKTGIIDFARQLNALGAELISTGGTARMIGESGVPVTEVAEVTGFPEMLDGRVKTLHPRIAGGILAIRERPAHMSALAEQEIQPIDMVVVNLYRFEEVAAKSGAPLEQLIENIDIGGPTLIRAAAKNYQDVAVVVSPEDYMPLLEELRENGCALSPETKWRLAKKAFHITAAYDSAIAARLDRVDSAESLPLELHLHAPKLMDLRYGENPHQSAALYGRRGVGIAGAEQLQGKELSYNNLVDLDAAWQLVSEFSGPAAVIMKHTNPCGAAEQDSLANAYSKAFECDPLSAFGGVLGFNRILDEDTAKQVAETFIEAIAAPGYSPEALRVFVGANRKSLRLLRVPPASDALVVKSISGGFLAQTPDEGNLDRNTASVKSRRAPTDEEWHAMEFAWKVAKHVKSNAIVYARPGQTVGIGAGQMSRVDSVKVGAMKAILPLHDTVVASDAFFPFPDGVEEAVKSGATAFIQPGGSVGDAKVIEAADRLGAAMVFTGMRHFRH
ncbi:MAG: bifunctional phosphoribosylaminoimidazolecarboxamide formyltransferase/IMP cyclohydrolase [Acidobacteriia bacterium]|nr:bifunctional phosphoribosylaminoimidazolecarboxamide formyltransferase/IMP cyclohydrolase [Terriglobia bacterium]